MGGSTNARREACASRRFYVRAPPRVAANLGRVVPAPVVPALGDEQDQPTHQYDPSDDRRDPDGILPRLHALTRHPGESLVAEDKRPEDYEHHADGTHNSDSHKVGRPYP